MPIILITASQPKPGLTSGLVDHPSPGHTHLKYSLSPQNSSTGPSAASKRNLNIDPLTVNSSWERGCRGQPPFNGDELSLSSHRRGQGLSLSRAGNVR